ncbi:MAG: glucose-6-phosphate isomerase [Acidiferrobacterales bacterium]|nr:glucose-6-phosphate isomerase [Acidiferrobacterales bacterium]
MTKPSLNPQSRERLESLAIADQKQGISLRFNSDSERAEQYSIELDELFFDFSKTHLSQELIDIYRQLAEQCAFSEQRHALFSGQKINSTEQRSVLHALLRDTENQGISMVSSDLLEQARDAKQQLLDQCEAIQSVLAKRQTPVKDIIHIGIGGSSLGTQLLFEAIATQLSTVRIHFVGNIDAHKLVQLFSNCSPQNTIVIGVSKTFTTAETLQNIRSIAQWYEDNGIDDYWQYFYAVTANYDNAIEFGINPDNIVTFPKWVGGRYSVWSSVSLSAVLVMGIERFEEFLAGAAAVDQHFYQTDVDKNVCFIAAMLDHYYANFMHASSRAIFAYDSRLESLVSYLQQLETESNGKDRQKNGEPVDQKTSPVVWGGVGTDVQHSVFQMLHQGTSLIPSEFIIVKTPDHDLQEHHTELLANAVAQTAALLAGQSLSEVTEIHKSDELPDLTLKAKVFSGEKPSSTIILERLTPRALGGLLAFYEHRVFCGGVLNNINSYDQMGVELGKRLAKKISPLLTEGLSGNNDDVGLDASTQQLIRRLLDK